MKIILYTIIVSGDANFSMKATSFTVGGFNQPYISRSLIEQPNNVEKGLSQRFLWLFPKPVYAHFNSLEPIDDEFVNTLGELVHQTCTSQLINAYIKNETQQ